MPGRKLPSPSGSTGRIAELLSGHRALAQDDARSASIGCTQQPDPSGLELERWGHCPRLASHRRAGSRVAGLARGVPLRGGHGRLPDRGRLQRARASRPTTGSAWEQVGRVEPSGNAVGFWERPEEALDRAAALGATASAWVSSGPGSSPTTGAWTGRPWTATGHRDGLCRTRPRAAGHAAPLHPSGLAGRGLLAAARTPPTASGAGPRWPSTPWPRWSATGSPSTRSTSWPSDRGCSGCSRRGGSWRFGDAAIAVDNLLAAHVPATTSSTGRGRTPSSPPTTRA